MSIRSAKARARPMSSRRWAPRVVRLTRLSEKQQVWISCMDMRCGHEV